MLKVPFRICSLVSYRVVFSLLLAYSLVLGHAMAETSPPGPENVTLQNTPVIGLDASPMPCHLDLSTESFVQRNSFVVKFLSPVQLDGSPVVDKPADSNANEIHVGGFDRRYYYTKEEVNYMISHGCIFSILLSCYSSQSIVNQTTFDCGTLP
ncbi:MAG: hypothetical protein WC001_05090 [Desulfurivibrionaceae bacterium]